MRKVRLTLVPALFVTALVLVLPLTDEAQNREKFVITAKAGGVNAVTGRASMRSHGNSEWQQLTIKEDLEAGDVVKTGSDGRVEMLLNPGSYLRVGENSEFELADNSLENLEVRLSRGTAIVEVTGADDEDLLIGITTPHTRMSIVRRGLYRVSVVPGDNTELIVRKGRVMLEGSHTKVKGGDKVVFSNTSFSVAKLSDTDVKGAADLESWSKDRAQTLAKENSRITENMMMALAARFTDDGFSNDFFHPGGAGFWLRSRNTYYTFVPYDRRRPCRSPYGAEYSRSIFGAAAEPGGSPAFDARGRTGYDRPIESTRESGAGRAPGSIYNPPTSAGQTGSAAPRVNPVNADRERPPGSPTTKTARAE